MTNSASSARFGGDIAEQRYADLFDRYKRHLAWVGVLVIVAGVAAWFYGRSQQLKSERAQNAYQAAIQTAASGNIPLAESDLKKTSVRYAGTDAGTEAAMALAKLSYQQGKYQAGIDALADAVTHDSDMRYDAQLLRGAGFEGLKQWAAAAREYETAASDARFDADRDGARAMQARVLQLAGSKDAAIKIWNDLARNPSSSFAVEAKVRLGELEARPMKV